MHCARGGDALALRRGTRSRTRLAGLLGVHLEVSAPNTPPSDREPGWQLTRHIAMVRASVQLLGVACFAVVATVCKAQPATAAVTFERFNGSIVVGCCPKPGDNGTGVLSAGTTDTQDACEALCAASNECTGYTWESADPAGGKEWALACLLRTDGEFDLTESGQFSGRKPCPGPSGTGGNYGHLVLHHVPPDARLV